MMEKSTDETKDLWMVTKMDYQKGKWTGILMDNLRENRLALMVIMRVALTGKLTDL